MRTLITHINGVGHALTEVSGLVSTLAGGSSSVNTGPRVYGGGGLVEAAARDLANLAEQALELASPVLDYEAAAREAGWKPGTKKDWRAFRNKYGTACHVDDADNEREAWQGICRMYHIDPHEREVFEHWAVPAFIADRLDALAERVQRDFDGLIVWARAAQPDGSKPDIGQCPTFRRMRLGT